MDNELCCSYSITTHAAVCQVRKFSPLALRFWINPSLDLDISIDANRSESQILKNRIANSVDTDETARSRLICIYSLQR